MGRCLAMSAVRLGRAVRGLCPDRNPLRRTYDRVEAGILAGLFVLLVSAAPFGAVLVARSAYSASLGVERAQHARSFQVTAVMVDDALTGAYGATALAKWTAPAGAVRSGVITVQPGSKAGARVKVWVDSSGRIMGSPMQASDVTANVVVAAVATVVAAGILVLTAGAAAHYILARKRLAAWGDDWRAIEPQWTHRL